MKHLYLLIFTVLFVSFCHSQDRTRIEDEKAPNKWGSLQINAGTMHVYRVLSIGYESPTLIQLGAKHQFRLAVNGGLWHARLYNSTVGTQFSSNLTYLFGGKPHKLEVGLGLTSHFVKGLKGQRFQYIGLLPGAFLGYRYEKTNGRLFFKGGLGWYQALQLGFGFRF